MTTPSTISANIKIQADESSAQSSSWTTLHSIIISKSVKSQCNKIISLRQPNDNRDFILVDIRIYLKNGVPTQYGICLTDFEFNQLAKSLVLAKDVTQIYLNKSGARRLMVKPKPSIRGVEITQDVNDRRRKISLNEVECRLLIEKYDTFYKLINDMMPDDLSDFEELEEVVPNESDSPNLEKPAKRNHEEDLENGKKIKN